MSSRRSAPAAEASGAALTDAALAAQLAEEAGRLLIEMQGDERFDRSDGGALGRAGDEAANRLLVEALALHRPDDGLLSEELRDTPERLDKSRVWIIDPLDGTREFGERRADWAVHVGLAIDGTASASAVALPGRRDESTGAGMILRTDQPRPLAPREGAPRLVVSRTRPPAEALAVAERIGGERIAMGSAGAKAMAVVLGEAEIYLHTGGQFEWDSCAPVAVARAHGLHCSRIDGRPLVYNRVDPYLPDLLICRAEWAERVLSELRAIVVNAPR